MTEALIRPASPTDAEPVRSLVTRSLLAAGFPPPDGDLDPDLLDLAYYEEPGRGIWVAEREGVVVGCAALDRGDASTGVLRRLAGGALEHLVDTVLDRAREDGMTTVETVLPPGLPGVRDALRGRGFRSPEGASQMLLRVDLDSIP